MFSKLSSNKQIGIVILIGLLVRLIALPFVQTDDADAVSRIFIAYRWLQNPYLIKSAVWLPIHHYLNALAIWISGGELVYTPKILNILFAVATVIPLYKFTENEFKSKEGAFFVSLTYIFIPIVIRNSLQALAGIPYAFFVVTSMYFLSQGKKLNKPVLYGVLAGFSLTIASGIRYEAWLLIAAFFLVLVLQKQWKMLFSFWIVAMIFPVFWMAGSYLEHGDIFYGSHGAYRWNILMLGGNENLNWDRLLWRIIYFPLRYIILITPIIFLATIYYLVKFKGSKEIKRNILVWMVPFISLLIAFIIKAYNGTLLLQPRFVLSLVITSLPFYAVVFLDKKHSKFKYITALLIIVLIIPYSYAGERSMGAFPVIKGKTAYKLLGIIKDESRKNDSLSLVLDFIGWDDTYFIRLRSGISPGDVFLVNGAKYGKVYANELANVIKNNKAGIIVKKNESKLDDCFHFLNDSTLEVQNVGNYLSLSRLYKNDQLALYYYKLENKAPVIFYSDRKLVKDNKDKIQQLEMNIRADSSWYHKIVKEASVKHLETDTLVLMNAIYVYKQGQKDNN